MKHFYLVSGVITYLEEGVLKTHPADVVRPLDDQKISVTELGQIQTALQMRFHQFFSRHSEVAPNIVNVTVLNICYLGEQEPDEFYKQSQTK